jgi:hypothetical protein
MLSHRLTRAETNLGAQGSHEKWLAGSATLQAIFSAVQMELNHVNSQLFRTFVCMILLAHPPHRRGVGDAFQSKPIRSS